MKLSQKIATGITLGFLGCIALVNFIALCSNYSKIMTLLGILCFFVDIAVIVVISFSFKGTNKIVFICAEVGLVVSIILHFVVSLVTLCMDFCELRLGLAYTCISGIALLPMFIKYIIDICVAVNKAKDNKPLSRLEIYEILERLKALKESGVITEEDYQLQRAKYIEYI